MWNGIKEYFVFEQDSEYVISFRLKKCYKNIINQSFRYLLIDQEDRFVVYRSITNENDSLVIDKNVFLVQEDAILFIREEIQGMIDKNLLYFIFGK
ncbi:hypothetical protein AAGG74_17190 [Bacillus mexicanus]|uniref:hypothetical protein n=1 Tax=Bacillus mexicanus TaxID=2834415 RepID=UPI003D1DB0EB